MDIGSNFILWFLLMLCCDAASIQPKSFAPPEGFRKYYAEHLRGNAPRGISIPLSRGVGSAEHIMRRDESLAGSPLTAIARNLLANVTIGDQPFQLVVDTGSSDTWVATKNFTCLNQRQQSVSQKTCNIPNLYTQPANASVVPGVRLDQGYASGEFVFGPMVLETVTVGTATVQNSQVGAVENAFWRGDGLNGGLLGLSGRATTTARDTNNKPAPYDPFILKMFQQKVSAPFFSISLDVVSSGPAGFLVFGGLPPVAHASEFTTVPIIKKNKSFQGSFTSPQIVDYIVATPSFTVNGQVMPMQDLEMVVDSGTYSNIVPDDLANKINDFWNPPARFNQSAGLFTIDCGATAPDVGVTLANGATITMTSKAAVLKENGRCFSAWAGGGPLGGQNATFVLGDVFMKSVVSVFDLGTADMHFAARV